MGTTRKAAWVEGVLDATARRGPRMSGARISNCDGGKLPWSSVLTDTDPTETDHRTVIVVLGKKPVPDTVTMVPGGPRFGVSTRWGTAGRPGRDGG